MIKHIVTMRLREDDKATHLVELKNKLESLKEKINALHFLEVGLNFSQSPLAGDILLYTEFNSTEDLETYRQHPEHQEVVKYLKTIVSETRVVDYEV